MISTNSLRNVNRYDPFSFFATFGPEFQGISYDSNNHTFSTLFTHKTRKRHLERQFHFLPSFLCRSVVDIVLIWYKPVAGAGNTGAPFERLANGILPNSLLPEYLLPVELLLQISSQ